MKNVLLPGTASFVAMLIAWHGCKLPEDHHCIADELDCHARQERI